MGFEKVVLEKVEKIVKADNLAGFHCGTLSVICTEAEAKRIAKKLSKDLMTKIQINRDGSYGYLFDFVA
jgi:hypothetical protein